MFERECAEASIRISELLKEILPKGREIDGFIPVFQPELKTYLDDICNKASGRGVKEIYFDGFQLRLAICSALKLYTFPNLEYVIIRDGSWHLGYWVKEELKELKRSLKSLRELKEFKGA